MIKKSLKKFIKNHKNLEDRKDLRADDETKNLENQINKMMEDRNKYFSWW